MARRLTASFFLRSIAYPLLTIFTGAYIYQSTGSSTNLILYYLGNFLMLPFMFLVNGRLLKRISLLRLYTAGTVLSGIAPLLVVFQRGTGPFTYLLYGALYGFGVGIYWANRNFLTVRYTDSANRSYFTGLQFFLGTVSSVAVPPLAGAVIVFTPHGYELSMLTAFGFLIAAGFMLRGSGYAAPDMSASARHPLSPQWRRARLLSVAIGSADSAIYILPTVLVLYAVGNEAVLGIVSGLAAVLSAAASYVFGRKYRQIWFIPWITAAYAAFAVSGIPLIAGITLLSIIWYLVLANMADSIAWIANEPVLMDEMDAETRRSGVSLYRLIVDREFSINTGRVAVLILFLVLTRFTDARSMGLIATICGLTAISCVGLARRNASA